MACHSASACIRGWRKPLGERGKQQRRETGRKTAGATEGREEEKRRKTKTKTLRERSCTETEGGDRTHGGKRGEGGREKGTSGEKIKNTEARKGGNRKWQYVAVKKKDRGRHE